MDHEDVKPSPGLNMDHGFLKKIEQNQIFRERQAREDAGKRQDSAKMARKVGFHPRTSKPAMEIYRPPSLRVSGDFSPFGVTGSGMNVENAEAINWMQQQVASSACAMPTVQSIALSKSRSTTLAYDMSTGSPIGLSKSRSTTAAHRVHFQLHPVTMSINPIDDYDGDDSGPSRKELQHSTGSFGLKRSRSLGAGDMMLFTSQELDVTCFNPEIQAAIKRALEDPNKMPARQLMEVVRHLFNRVLESCKYAEPIARLCMGIIQKEKNETFLESLLNSCREWYNERDRLFSEDGGGGGGSGRSASSRQSQMKPSKWVAYVTFLYELYTRLKSRKQTPMISTSTPPSAIILTLLSECCILFLKPSSLLGHSEIECLFIVLTSIGRDLQNEFPSRMQSLISGVRDAFLATSTPQAVRKTLLQLIELNASNWQLKSQAVTYYYPGNQRE